MLWAMDAWGENTEWSWLGAIWVYLCMFPAVFIALCKLMLERSDPLKLKDDKEEDNDEAG